MKIAIRCVLASLLICLNACNAKKEFGMDDNWSKVKANIAFTCAKESDSIPARDPEADQLYKYARWLHKNNRLKEDPVQYPKIERLIRIATAYGHDKANLELRDMIAAKKAASDDPVKEMRDLVNELIERGIPGGYYDMGHYIESGALGFKQDPELALKYYRKSADMGSPDGQYLVGDKLTDAVKNGRAVAEIGLQMYECAAQQGHAKAASDLGDHYATEGKFKEALVAFQAAVKAGDGTSAFGLEKAFGGVTPEAAAVYLGQTKDEERVRRYKIISNFLSDYSYLNPTVPEIDEIAPLPPFKLQPWDGKLKWLEAHKANVPPALPTEARISEMAKAKGLDPATGRRSVVEGKVER
jgi:TPR repeat protein